ncbi:MAG: VCBS repeat-containing protein [candidate division WOR-3 bacterium]|nr:VCBS repeat-containing protein [candidate division WOR-3 bacterium]MDW8150298.1 VCBS repeat-containing protein [candidate division WOR-3 bacterium]
MLWFTFISSPFYDKVVSISIKLENSHEVQNNIQIDEPINTFGIATFNRVQLCNSPFIPGNKWVLLINDRGLIKDIDNNGLNDIVFITADSNNNGFGVVRIAYQTSLGNFNCVPVGNQTRYLPYGLVVGDFNSDGRFDIANANAMSRTVNILINLGNGNFKDTTISNPLFGFLNHISAYGSDIYFTEEGFRFFRYNYLTKTLSVIDDFIGMDRPCHEGLSLADLNNDGRVDFVCSSGNTFVNHEGAVYYRLNQGNTWSSRYYLTIQHYYHGVTTGDINKDGRADIVSCTRWNDGVNRGLISIRMNQGGNPINFQSINVPIVYNLSSCELKIADLDCDGDNDIVWASGDSVYSNPLGWLENLGNNNWSPQIIENSPYRVYGLDVGYVNADKKPDIVVGLNNRLYVYYNTTNVNDNNCTPITPVSIDEGDVFELKDNVVVFKSRHNYWIYRTDGSLYKSGFDNKVFLEKGIFILRVKGKSFKLLLRR